MDNDLILERLNTMHEDMQGMRNSITQIAEAITRLAVLEEKQQTNTAMVTRLSEALEKTQTKLQTLELTQAVRDAQLQGAAWVGRALWAVAGGAVAAALPQLFKLLGG
jgi:hypothetical protein